MHTLITIVFHAVIITYSLLFITRNTNTMSITQNWLPDTKTYILTSLCSIMSCLPQLLMRQLML